LGALSGGNEKIVRKKNRLILIKIEYVTGTLQAASLFFCKKYFLNKENIFSKL
jgi:hypothetical protein